MDKSRNWRIGATSFLVTAAFWTGSSAVPVQAASAMDPGTNERIVSSVSSNPSAALKKEIMREANLALRALKDRDFETLSDMAAPSGIRFSPYAYVGGRSGIGNVGGMDWGSLRFVFEQKQGEWKLSGIISDQWTI